MDLATYTTKIMVRVAFRRMKSKKASKRLPPGHVLRNRWPYKADVAIEFMKCGPAPKSMQEARNNLERVSLKPASWLACSPVAGLDGVPCFWVSERTRLSSDSKTPDISTTGPVVFYLHGGGYCTMRTGLYLDLLGRLSREIGSPVFSVDYRLAPEHPYPAAVDDAIAAYLWLTSPDGGAIDHSRVIISGDSAGGGLTMATAIRLREEHPNLLPAALAVISPWCDLSGEASKDSMVRNKPYDFLQFSKEGSLDSASFYAGEAGKHHPGVSPLRADLKGLPPTLVTIGTLEEIADEGTALAKALEAVGNKVVYKEYEGMPHVFQVFAAFFPAGKLGIADIASFCREHVNTQNP